MRLKTRNAVSMGGLAVLALMLGACTTVNQSSLHETSPAPSSTGSSSDSSPRDCAAASQTTTLAPRYDEIQDRSRRLLSVADPLSQEQKDLVNGYWTSLQGKRASAWKGWVAGAQPDRATYESFTPTAGAYPFRVLVQMRHASTGDEPDVGYRVELLDVRLTDVRKLDVWLDEMRALGPTLEEAEFSGIIRRATGDGPGVFIELECATIKQIR